MNRTNQVRAYVACILRSSMYPGRPTGVPLEIWSDVSPVFPSEANMSRKRPISRRRILTKYLLQKDTLNLSLIAYEPSHALNVGPIPLALFRLVFGSESVLLMQLGSQHAKDFYFTFWLVICSHLTIGGYIFLWDETSIYQDSWTAFTNQRCDDLIAKCAVPRFRTNKDRMCMIPFTRSYELPEIELRENIQASCWQRAGLSSSAEVTK